MFQPAPDRNPDHLPLDDDRDLSAYPAYAPVDDGLPLSEAVPGDPLAFADSQLRMLGLALGFGPEDLAYNSEGELSPAQIAQLQTDLKHFYWPMIGVLATIALVLGTVSLFAGPVLLLPMLLCMAAALIPAFFLRQERASLPDRQVERTMLRMGTLSLVARRWGFNEKNTLPVPDGKPIYAPKHLYRSLQANRTYILYYAPVRTEHGYRLLSLEPTDDDFAPEKPKRKAKRGGGF